MTTIEQLKKENRKLKSLQSNLKDMQKIQQERINLKKENEMLAKQIKSGKSSHIGKTIGKSVGKTTLKIGKGAFRGLQRYSNYLHEQERKQKRLNKNLKSVKKKKKSCS